MKKAEKSLFVAISQSDSNSVHDALLRGADPDASDHLGRTALMIAARLDDVESMKMLLFYKCNPDQKSYLGRVA